MSNLTPNNKKCGIIYPPDTPSEIIEKLKSLRLYHETIPIVNQYKYLGMEFNNKGMDLQAFFQRSLKKANDILQYVITIGSSWNMYERLVVYKTFVLPIPMYGAPCLQLQLLVQPNNSTLNSIESELNELTNSAGRWIVGSDNFNNGDRAVLGMVRTKTLIEHATIILKNQIENHGGNTPVGLIYSQARTNAYEQMSTSVTGRLHQLQFPENETGDTSLKKCLTSKAIKEFQQISRLGAYIPPIARTPTGCALTVKYGNKEQIRWRRNKDLHAECPKCPETKFSRRHYKCLLDLYGQPPAKYIMEPPYEYPTQAGVTALDVALNMNDSGFFHKAINGEGWIPTIIEKCEEKKTKREMNTLINEVNQFLDQILDDPMIETGMELIS